MMRKLLVMSVALCLLAACTGAAAPTAAPTAAPAAPAAAPTEAPTSAAAPVAPTEAITATVAVSPTEAITATVAVTPTEAIAATVAVTPTEATAPAATAPVTPAAALAPTVAATGVVTSTAPEEGGIPTIPHPLEGRNNCLGCHVVGGAAEAVPADHAGRTNDSCQGCHKPAPAGAQAPTPSVPVGDAAAGQKLFQTVGCSACHSTEPDKKIVGPSLAGIASDAGDSVKEPEYKGKATDAAGWLQESIVNPNVDVPEGFSPNVMPQDFGKKLTSQQISDLVAYLLTLK